MDVDIAITICNYIFVLGMTFVSSLIFILITRAISRTIISKETHHVGIDIEQTKE